jgi:hypothetical protein
MRVNLRGQEAPDGEGAQPVRRSLWSYGHLLLRSAKLDPRAPRRRFRSQRCFSFLLIRQGRGLRDRSGGCRTRTRSLPGFVRQLPEGSAPDFAYSNHFQEIQIRQRRKSCVRLGLVPESGRCDIILERQITSLPFLS